MASQYEPLPLSQMVNLVELEANLRHLQYEVHWQDRSPHVHFGLPRSDVQVRLSLDDEIFLLKTLDGFEMVASEIGAIEQRELIQELVDVISKYLHGEYTPQSRRGLRGVQNYREVAAGSTVYVFHESRT